MAIAKAECTCRICGNKFIYRKEKANRREADSFEAWAAENIDECPDCKYAEKEDQRTKENAAAAQASAENGYLELQGTERQIPWATTIRQKAVGTIHSYCTDPKYKKHFPWLHYSEERFTALLLTHTRAAWWIDNRGKLNDIESLCRTLLECDGEEYRKVCADIEAFKKAQNVS